MVVCLLLCNGAAVKERWRGQGSGLAPEVAANPAALRGALTSTLKELFSLRGLPASFSRSPGRRSRGEGRPWGQRHLDSLALLGRRAPQEGLFLARSLATLPASLLYFLISPPLRGQVFYSGLTGTFKVQTLCEVPTLIKQNSCTK